MKKYDINQMQGHCYSAGFGVSEQFLLSLMDEEIMLFSDSDPSIRYFIK